MFTLEDIRRAIGSDEDFHRAQRLFASGAVRQVSSVDHRTHIRYFGIVREGLRSYLAAFNCKENDAQISDFSCECSDYERRGHCPHICALMLHIAGAEEQEVPRKEKRMQFGQFSAHREEMARRREKFRMEALQREQERLREEQNAREERRFAIDSIIGSGVRGRFVQEKEEKVSLFPILSRREDVLELELRIGEKKPYVVRSFKDFARRMERSEVFVYGKDLTFQHRQENVRQEDHALLWQIIAMAQQGGDGAKLTMSGAQTDQMMRLLAGREVDWRSADGKLVRVLVEPGEGEFAVGVLPRKETGEYTLRVDAPDVLLGTSGAYFLMPQEGKILCTFGRTFEQIAPLLRLAKEYPQGAVLEQDQLLSACANLIMPAEQWVKIVQGEEIVRGNTPMTLITRFYIDIPEKNRLSCRIVFDYGAAQLSAGEENPHIRRDTTAEDAAVLAACRLFPIVEEDGSWAFEGDDDACFDLVSRRLSQLTAYGEVMIAQRLMQMDEKKRSTMTIGVSVSEPGMLLVKADLGGLSQEDLMAAYAAYRQKKKYVRLTDGTFLSGEALDQAAEAAQTLESMDVTAEQAQEGTQIPASRAMYLDAALKERESIRLSAPKAVSDWITRLKKAQNTRAENPKTLKATLRDYQLEGLSWLTALEGEGFGGILADDMGLGKTMQALALLLSCKERGEAVRALVVCPASLQLNWENEAEKFAPTLSVCAMMGDAKDRIRKIQEDPPCELLIVSYDQLRRDVQAYKGIVFSHIFLDEAQNIKNAASQAAKAVKTLRASHRFAMTGTPIENRLSELWSIFDFLMPGYLLDYKKFKTRFETPIVKDGDEKTLENLRLMTAPFILRRMKADVLDDLPEKTEKIMTSEMTPEQERVYRAHAAQLITQAEGGFVDQADRIRMLAGLTRLRQICCDPSLCLEEYSGGSGKLEQCLELIGECIAGGHRVLLFSQFTSMLDVLKERLNARGIDTFLLTGSTEKQARMEMVEHFNDGGAPVFLISLKAGGTGLNLTGADVVIHYDPWWNISAQNQATDRAYRIGQKRGVQVFKLIAQDSIEARILKLQQHKSALSDGVLTGEENLFTMDAQALKNLLR